jgi:hypothetical protein
MIKKQKLGKRKNNMPESKHYDKLFTKEQLEEEYQDKSVCDIAKKYNIANTNIYRLFSKFGIVRRKCNSPGNLASGFKHGKCSRFIRKHCKRCGSELSTNPNAQHCIKCHNYLNSINKNRLKKLSKSIKEGWRTKNFAKLLHSKKTKYRGIWMRSGWEKKYAEYLDKQNIKWLYESKTFDLGNTTYTPDFYLPETNEYIEIKGYLRNSSKNKMIKFKKIFNNLLILNKKKLIKLGVL